MVSKLTEGWMAEKRYETKRYHYIRGQMSLCQQLGFYTGDLQPDAGLEAPGHEDCKSCFRKLRIAQAKAKREAEKASQGT